MSEQKHATYKDAGVDIDAGNEFVQRIKQFVKATERPEVIGDIGGFGGLFSGEKVKKMDHPVFVSGTDGVGTKLKLAFLSDRHDTVGIDLVAMCVNDIVVQGAEPLFFLDYLATGKLEPEKAALVVKGIAKGCIQAGCALIGGETAELPGFYHEGEYDLAGFAVGAVEKSKIINGSNISAGNKLIGIASSGLHSNGFSLARKIIFEIMGFRINDELPGFGKTVADELLTPTKIYAKGILSLIETFDINGIAHITGGGLLENIPRILPENCKAIIHKSSWRRHLIFDFLQKNGNIEESEMLRTFNCGIGMVIAVKDEELEDILLHLACLGEDAFLIGGIVERRNGEEPITFL